jgi:hypothetical protein
MHACRRIVTLYRVIGTLPGQVWRRPGCFISAGLGEVRPLETGARDHVHWPAADTRRAWAQAAAMFDTAAATDAKAPAMAGANGDLIGQDRSSGRAAH